jgi:NADH-quinone oxidoreductase subunit N
VTLLGQVQTIDLPIPHVDWWAVAPALSLFTAALVIVLVRSLARRVPSTVDYSVAIALVGIAASASFTARLWIFVNDRGPYQAIAGSVAVDGFSIFVEAVVLAATFLTVLLSARYLRREALEGAEYVALVLLSATGMMIMASANDLIVVFLALEVLSIALYVLTAFDRRRADSQEAGLKYFVLGAFSSAIFLYGIALVYGGTGTTNLTGIASYLASHTILDSGVFLAGLALLLVGFGFKIAAAPFHMWTPDVYQGAPTPITAFMASAVKVAAFGALLRVFAGSLDAYRTDWRPIVFALAVLSMVVGAAAAVVQTDVKRLLAYSSIAHAGFVLVGVQAASARGTAAALNYLLVYAFMAIGAFGVVMVVARRGDERHSVDDYRGLSGTEPVLAGVLTLFLLAQVGVPLTGGFVAKLSVFSAAADAGQYALVIVATLASVVSAFAYLRVALAMYAPGTDIEPAEEEPSGPRLRVDALTSVALTVAVAAVLATGIVPDRFLDFARHATLLLARG